jgi:ribosomal protein S18 acetylase RimI-like enzyme
VDGSAQRTIVELAPMSTAQFEKWKPTSIADYAMEHTISGKWTAADAPRLAREEFERLLPQGMATPSHRFFSIELVPDRQSVGMLWIQIESAPRPVSYVFNIEIDKPFRRRGYARQAMKLLEEEARRLGLESIGLHVFGHNAAARALYEELGYVATNIYMKRRLADASSPSHTKAKRASAVTG